MELDERLRERLGRLAQREEAPELDERAVDRIAQRVAIEARRRNASALRVGLGAVAGIAAAAALGLWMTRGEPAAAPLACASWTAPRDLDPGSERFDFDRRVLAVLAPGAALRVERAEACSLHLTLERGRVTVHARDLGGGDLRVRAGSLDAVVRGTLFAVERTDDGAVEVDVVEGEVVGERAGERLASARAGQGFVARGAAIERRALDARAAGAVRASLRASAPPSPVPAAEVAAPEGAAGPEMAEPAGPEKATDAARASATDLLSRARRAKAAQAFDDARSLYRAAGAGRAADAEAAWLDLARLEIEQRRLDAARDALHERQQRFGDDSALALEAANAELRLERAAGRRAEARAVATRIVERWPDTPYAAQARRQLSREEGTPK